MSMAINIPGYLNGPLGVILEAIDSTRGVETYSYSNEC